MRAVYAVAAVAVAVAYALLVAVPQQGVQQPDSEDAAIEPIPLDLGEAAGTAPRHLAEALAFQTLASKEAPNHVGDPAPFRQMHDWMRRTYPLVFERLEAERVNEYSLLLTWRGKSPELHPMLAMAHYDVVPAPTEGTNWTHPPFSGAIADGFIWGRGALDFKVGVVQLLEAASLLLRRGFQPQRTLLLAIGHDEEVGGAAGAAAIAELLRSRGVELELVLDEGGSIMMDGLGKDAAVTITEDPVALIGTAEKGYETWEIKVQGTGGHSSMPPVDSSSVAARVARIVAALEAQPTTTKLGAPTTEWLAALAPAVKLAPLRLLLQNADNWILNPVLGQVMGQAGREIAPFVRTTCAVVGIQAGGIAENVLPPTATILLNFRVLPGQDSAFVAQYLGVITAKEGPHVSLRQLPTPVPATPVAPSSGPHWRLLKQAILETLPPPQGLHIAPYLLAGMTDSRHYNALAGGRVYRFAPQRFTLASLRTVHGVDERIAVEDFLRGIGFYTRILELATQDEGSEEAAAEAAGAAAAE